MHMKDKMHTGALYLPGDPEIQQEQLKRLDRLYDFNQTRPSEMEKRNSLNPISAIKAISSLNL